eukprot:TRINITY_DN36697_c0_g1_i1.p1 TRINITY_DN36697_c0_g1~~TRINITY_DN36697_c0_g1_i1.p1  ORF type:complete len:227 (-),score=63.98 TRINITY_DN36697_c0_g1_i1:31-624(-)
MLRSLVGSEMCIRDRARTLQEQAVDDALRQMLPPPTAMPVSVGRGQEGMGAELTERERELVRRKLELYGIKEYVVAGDGNCQFRALSHQLCGDDQQYASVRKHIVAHLKAERGRYREFVAGQPYEDYLRTMAKDGTWGDALTLQAAADTYGAEIKLVSSYDDERGLMVLKPSGNQVGRHLWLVFWAELHYNSVVFEI